MSPTGVSIFPLHNGAGKSLVSRKRRNGKSLTGVSEWGWELAVLERIRRRFAPAAASCNQWAKTVVAVVTQMMAERKRGRPHERRNGSRTSID
jgi:hypothetical protein